MGKDILILWNCNDWGLFGRRHEMVAEELSNRREINKIIHIDAPLSIISLLRRLFWYLRSPNQITWLEFKNSYLRIFARRRLSTNSLFVYSPFILFPQKRLTSKGKIFDLNMKFVHWQIKRILKEENVQKPMLWCYPPHPFISYMISYLNYSKLVVDLVDKLDEQGSYDNSQKGIIASCYIDSVSKADIVFSVAKGTANYFKHSNHNIHWIPNGYANSVLNSHNDLILKNGKKIIGYAGRIVAERMDLSLLEYLIQQQPDCIFYFIGQVQEGFENSWFHIVKKYNNLFYHSPVIYSDIIGYINSFDVCIIPHLVNKTTIFMDPIKLYYYFAAGKPVVTTSIAFSEEFKAYVYQAKDKNEFLAQLRKALSEDNHLADSRKQIVSTCTWSSRVNSMMKLLLEDGKDEYSH